MHERIAIIGAALSPLRATYPELSYKELMFATVSKALLDAGIDKDDVDSLVTCSDDLWEGRSIGDEFVPDQIGGALKPNNRINADGVYGIFQAFMQIRARVATIVTVVAHSKSSDLLTKNRILNYALDPVIERPLAQHPYFIPALEATRYMYETGITPADLARVVVKNRQTALKNPYAAYGAKLTPETVLNSPKISSPLTELDAAYYADGVAVVILAPESVAKNLKTKPVYVLGIGWDSESAHLGARNWGRADYAYKAGIRAYEMAGIKDPAQELDFAEIDDRFSYKELMHAEALRLVPEGQSKKVLTGETIPINPSGGYLGLGYAPNAAGLTRVVEAVFQLRGEAGSRQVKNATKGLVFGWYGPPSASGGAVILGNE